MMRVRELLLQAYRRASFQPPKAQLQQLGHTAGRSPVFSSSALLCLTSCREADAAAECGR